MKLGHALSTDWQTSRHGSSSLYDPCDGGKFWFLGVEDAFCGRRAADIGDDEDGSPHRGNDIAQSHFRYSSWQFAQLCRGE